MTTVSFSETAVSLVQVCKDAPQISAFGGQKNIASHRVNDESFEVRFREEKRRFEKTIKPPFREPGSASMGR